MRIAILLLAIIAMGCNGPKKYTDADMEIVSQKVHQLINHCDSSWKADSAIIYDQAIEMHKRDILIDKLRDSINVLVLRDCSKMQRERDSLRSKLMVQNFKIGRIQYYVNICNRKPSQDKFLRGWINRTLK